MTLLEKYKWEATHITTIAGVVIFLTLVTHVFGTSGGKNSVVGSAVLPNYMPPSPVVTAPPAAAARTVDVSTQKGSAITERSDPHEITVGPSGISNRYRLLSVERRSGSSKTDELTVRLHVESLAMENLVSPFGSDMLEIAAPGLQPINPSRRFDFP